ncbi:polymorphic toxin-type HINT domain-containing protein [Spirillospora sp. CA-255316]
MIARNRCRDADTCHFEWFGYHINQDDPFDPRNDQLFTRQDQRSADIVDTTYQTWWGYNEYGEPTGEVYPKTPDFPNGRTIFRTYTDGTEDAVGGGKTPAGLVKTEKDARGNVTSNRYTAAGDLAETVEPEGLIERYTHDVLGRLLTRTEISDSQPGGVTTTYTYDALGNETSQTGPGVRNEVTGVTHTTQTRTTYDPDSLPLTETVADTTGGDPDRTTTYTYDDHGRVATQTGPEGGEERYSYDATGARTGLVDVLGNTYTFTYTPRGQLATTTLKDFVDNPNDPAEPRDVVLESLAYDPGGRLASRTDAMGRTLRYTYYGDDLTHQVIADGVRLNDSAAPRDVVLETRAYDPAGNLTTQITGGGKTRIDYTYDQAGRRTAQIVDPEGLARRTEFAYDADDNIIRQTLTTGGNRTEEIRYAYDGMGRPIRETVENGDEDPTSTVTRDDRGLVVASVDPRGNAPGVDPAQYRTTLRYDVVGQLVEAVQPQVNVERRGGTPAPHRPVTRYGYNTAGERTHVTDPEGRTVTTAYDRDGRPRSVTSPSYTPPGGSSITPKVTAEYDEAGQLVKQTDARGNTRHFGYDQLGRLVRTSDPQIGDADPGTVRYYFDLVGEQLAVVDQTGARAEATYDDLGRPVTSTIVERRPTPAAHTTRMAYDDADDLTTVTAPTGGVTRHVHNAAGERTETVEPQGGKTTFAYDMAGRTTKVTDPLGKASVIEYDLAGRETATKDLDDTGTVVRTLRTGYDLAGNPTSETGGEGHTIRRAFDAADRLTEIVEPVADGQTITTRFGYDASGAQTRLTDGRGNTTIAAYNTLGLVESITEPATTRHPDAADRTWTTGYDAAGNAVSETAPGGVRVTRTFDELDRLTKQSGIGAEADTADKTYEYDLAGRRIAASAPGGKITYSYNDRGLPLRITDAKNRTTAFDYDPSGRLTGRTDAAGAATFGYDNGDRLTSVTDPVTGTAMTMAYDDADRLTGVNYGANGAKRTVDYDALDRPIKDEVTTPGSATLTSIGYEYDRDDNLIAKTTTGITGAGRNTYTYDHAGRLTSWTAPAGNRTDYEWDAAGNRTRAGADGFTYDERNRLLTGGTKSYTYTPRGTLATETSGGTTRTQRFDAFDQLINDGPLTYAYDALDRIAERTQDGNTTAYLYAGDQNDVVATANEGGVVSAAYGRDPAGDLLGMREQGAATLALTDRHDDVIATLAPNGTQLTGSTAYGPFGEILSEAGDDYDLGYQSEFTDPDSGRVNMHARWYQPDIGSFISRDTFDRDPDSSIAANRYGYGDAAPLDNTDPTGNCPFCVAAGAVGLRLGIKYGPRAARWGWNKYGSRLTRTVKNIFNRNKPPKGRPNVTRPASNPARNLRAAIKEGQKRYRAWKKAWDQGQARYRAWKRAWDRGQARYRAWKKAWDQGQARYRAWKKEWDRGYQRYKQSQKELAKRNKIRETIEKRVEAVEGVQDGVSAIRDAAENGFQMEDALDVVGAIGGVGRRGPPGNVRGDRTPAGTASCSPARRNSFVAGTQVLMADGTQKSIEKVRVGDKVVATDPETGRSATKPVTETISGQGDKQLVRIAVDLEGDSGQRTDVIIATDEHPFWVENARAWVNAGDLRAGTWLRSSAGTWVQVTAVKTWTQHRRVYNLTVADVHTYHVVVGTQALLVHNTNADDDECAGKATVYLHPKDPETDIGHASIRIDGPNESLHIHQVAPGGMDGPTYVQRWRGPVPEGSEAYTYDLPNANRALRQAHGALSLSSGRDRQSLGRYNIATNSCVTVCGTMLNHGGVPGVPRNSAKIILWLKGLPYDDLPD